ncbi:MAG: WXG100 family type VII secretion target [Bacillota bacterium]
MARIQVNPEELRAVAAQFRKSSEESNAMVQTLSTAVRNLDNNWDGLSSEKFYQDFEQWRQEMIHFVAVLDQIHQQLMAIAQRFEEADRPA